MGEARQGSLSINSENIFPIIKKWLYSDHDIFYREIISNGCDAITKRKKLDIAGEAELPEDYKAQVTVLLNPEEKTLKFIDNGIGMTEDEVDSYINQIAFSGATEFLEKYKDKTNEDQIIGHFGLGFYSAFMVADEVEIDSLSFKEGAEAVHWACDGGTEFSMEPGTWNEVGTQITLHLNEDCLEFANEYRAREVITKYCSFMPVEIYLEKEGAPTEYETIDEADLKDTDVVIEHIHEDAKTEERTNDKGEKETVEVSPAREKVKIEKRPVPLNDTNPLWAKHPNECTDEEYKDFYRKVFHDYKEPLFWIHLNMDYPFNLKGILYFPKINLEYESAEGVIKLYNNQVFIADNIKEVIPEFLMLLKGVIDCPDLPLNVSRSALQNDGFVKKISDYITKKVADKLSGMCKTDRENYEKYWDDIAPFIKYGCMKDNKFCDRMSDYLLFKDLDHKHLTLSEYRDSEGWKAEENAAAEDAENSANTENAEKGTSSEAGTDAETADASADNEKEKERHTVYYVSDEQQQSQYINMFRESKMNAIILDQAIDTPFISHLEARNEDLSFMRIDADLNASMKDENDNRDEEEIKKEAETITAAVRSALENESLEVHVEKLKDDKVASMMTLSEETRRMEEMMKMYGMGAQGMPPATGTLILNANHPLVKYIVENKDSEHTPLICRQLYDLAMMNLRQLTPDEMTKFIERSNEIMMIMTGK